jgi:hypothetical protein
MDKDWKIGLGVASAVMLLAFATGEPVRAASVSVNTLESLPMDSDGAQRLGALIENATGEYCGAARAWRDLSSDVWIGVCSGDVSNSFALTPSGDVVETGHISDVLLHQYGQGVSIDAYEDLIVIVSISN